MINFLKHIKHTLHIGIEKSQYYDYKIMYVKEIVIVCA